MRFREDDPEFDRMLDEHQKREAEIAAENEEAALLMSKRPTAVPVWTRYGDIEVGDYITADGSHWVEVVEVKSGTKSSVSESAPSDLHVSITFQTPLPLTVGLHDRWVIERKIDEEVRRDANV